MTGHHDLNRPAFDAAEKRLTAQGHFVINPHDLTALFGDAIDVDGDTVDVVDSFASLYWLETEDKNWDENQPQEERDWIIRRNEKEARLARAVMDADLAAVRSCDAIYLLHGWEESRGAKKELAEAIACRLQVMLEDDAVPVEQIEVQETTAEATCPRGETTNMGCVFCYDGVICSETGEVCPYYNKEEES